MRHPSIHPSVLISLFMILCSVSPAVGVHVCDADRDEHLIIGVPPNSAPLSFLNESRDGLQGLAVDLSMKMAEGMAEVVNGHFMKGMKKVLGGFFENRKANKEYEKKLGTGK